MNSEKSLARARPAGVYLLMVLLLFLGIGALGGGYALMADPTGGNLQFPLSWLEHTPFDSYLVPGIFLFTVLGVFPLMTVMLLWARPNWRLMTGIERVTHQHWSWLASLTVGSVLLVWLVVQFLMMGVRHPVQIGFEAFYAVLGLGILLVGLLPSVRRYYRVG